MHLAAVTSAVNTVTSELVTAGTTAGFTETSGLTIVESAINVVLGLLGIVAVCFIIYAGIIYLTSQGDDKKVTTAKNILMYAIVGMVVIAAAWALSWFILQSIIGNIVSPVTTETLWNTTE